MFFLIFYDVGAVDAALSAVTAANDFDVSDGTANGDEC